MHSRHKCVVCQTEYEPFMSFGIMPTANGFLLPEEFPTAYFFELKVGFCQNCTVVQQMGRNVRKYAIREHDIKKIVPKYVELIEKMVKQ